MKTHEYGWWFFAKLCENKVNKLQPLWNEVYSKSVTSLPRSFEPQPDITWFKADGALQPGRNGVTVDGALTIFNVGKKGRETYVCKAENILGAVSDTTQLMVFSPLRFKMNLPQGVTPALFGSTVCLPCVVESDLKTTIIWSRNGRSSLPVDAIVLQNNTLVLENFRKSHDESYSCVATNAVTKNWG